MLEFFCNCKLFAIRRGNGHFRDDEVLTSSREEDHHRYKVRLQDHYHLMCLGCGKVTEIPNRSRTIKGRRTPQDLAGRQSLLYVGEKGLSK